MLNTYDFVNPGFTKSHKSLDGIVSLENRITYEIVYDFRRDRTTVCRRRIWVSLDKARIKESHTTLGEIVGLHNCAVADITPQLQRERMIIYDLTCVITRQLGNSHSISHHARNLKLLSYAHFQLVCNSPLSHQIFMNVQSFCICQTPIETNDFPNTTYQV